jgi:hypothetical protein
MGLCRVDGWPDLVGLCKGLWLVYVYRHKGPDHIYESWGWMVTLVVRLKVDA